jgi:hypothetical protein
MPRFRIKLRLMMVAVAVLALPLAATSQILARKHRFQSLASLHRTESDIYLDQAGGSELLCGDALSRMSKESVAEMIEEIYKRRGHLEFHYYKLSMLHESLRSKYEEAALRPWLPVESDPPEVPFHAESQRSEHTARIAEMNAGWEKIVASKSQN